MGTTLVLIGIGCIIAGIVGGGITLNKLSVPSVTSLWRQGLLILFGAFLSLVGASLSVPDESRNVAPDMSANVVSNNVEENDSAANNSMDAGSDSNTGDNGAVSDVSYNTSDPSEIPQPESHKFYVENACSKQVLFWLVYKNSNGWTNSGGSYWTLEPGSRAPLNYDNVEIRPISDEIYVYAYSSDNAERWNGNVSLAGYNGLMRANIVTADDGTYDLSLTCEGK